jgi:translation initiation factor 3 subunit C
LKGRARWLKTTDNVVANDARRKKREANRLLQSQGGGKKKEVDGPHRADRRTATWNMQDLMTEEELDKKVNELIASRGRKSTDNRVILRQLEVLTKAARLHGPKKEIPVLSHLISSMFDSNRLIDEFMELQQWRTCHRSLSRILKLLEQNKHLVLGSISTDTLGEPIAADSGVEAGEGLVAVAGEKKQTVVKIVGSVDSYILRLEDEYVKSLQQIDQHSQVLSLSRFLSFILSFLSFVLSYPYGYSFRRSTLCVSLTKLLSSSSPSPS